MKNLSLLILFIFFFSSSFSQEANELTEEKLKAFFPQETGKFTLDQKSVVPFEELSINGLYKSTENSKDAFFVLLAEYKDAEERKEKSGLLLPDQYRQIMYEGYKAYEDEQRKQLMVFIGENLVIRAYKTGDGDVTLQQLRDALDAIDMLGLEEYAEFEEEHAESMEGVVVKQVESETEERDFDVFGRLADKPESYSSVEVEFDEIDCKNFNAEVKEKMKKQMGGGELVPWIVFLKKEQASTAWKDDGNLVFPKEGNDWLQCLSKNDLLWSPLEMPMFALRVKNIEAYPDRFVLEVESAGLNDFVSKGRVEMETGDNK
ncbi:MAG: hypothetical protein R3345_05410 [Fulvivirga sp.]|nr:hypothetical protein [Fulvivirga sp.]